MKSVDKMLGQLVSSVRSKRWLRPPSTKQNEGSAEDVDAEGEGSSGTADKTEVSALIQWYMLKYGRLSEYKVTGLKEILPEDEEESESPVLRNNRWKLKAILQRRNDREEIRRRLAMGSDTEDYYGGERMTRKPSLQTRLQSGMNLQICFLNETAGEHENISTENDESSVTTKNSTNRVKQESSTASKASSLPMFSLLGADNGGGSSTQSLEEMDFVTRQAKLQAEARLALAQAKEMAHMQMEIEKQRKKKSPITEMVGINFPDGRKIASRQVMNEMNFAQLQVIVNDLHTQIESLNEELVRLLLERDDLHMEQDSMLVDIEDLTRYLGAKDRAKKENQAETDTLSSKLSIASQKLTPKLMAKLKK